MLDINTLFSKPDIPVYARLPRSFPKDVSSNKAMRICLYCIMADMTNKRSEAKLVLDEAARIAKSPSGHGVSSGRRIFRIPMSVHDYFREEAEVRGVPLAKMITGLLVMMRDDVPDYDWVKDV